MTSKDLDDALDMALGTHEAFRRLGFSADDIYLGQSVTPDGTPNIAVHLKAQDKSFIVNVGPWDGTKEAWAIIAQRWAERVDLWNHSTTAVERRWRSGVWERWRDQMNLVHFIVGLHNKSFKFHAANINHEVRA